MPAPKQIQSQNAINGLETNPSLLAVTDGSLVIGENIVLNRQGMAESRRGFGYFADLGAEPRSILEFQDDLLVHTADGVLTHVDAATATQTALGGSWTAPGAARLRGVDARSNLYLNASSGLHKLDNIANGLRPAGMPPGLDLSGIVSGTGNGFLAGGYAAAYTMVWTSTDANGVKTVGAPTPAVTVVNPFSFTGLTITRSGSTATATTTTPHGLTTGDAVVIAGAVQVEYNGSFTVTVTGSSTFTYPVTGTPVTPATGSITARSDRDVTQTFSVPAGIASGTGWELYRSEQAPTASARPDPDYYLVKAGTWTSGSEVSTTDTALEAFLTTPLYTNSDQGRGALDANWFIPVASDVELHKDRLYLARTTGRYSKTITLLSASGGLVDDVSAVTIQDGTTSRTYTFSTAEDFTARKFKRVTTGLNSAQVEHTARSLVRAINQDSTGNWWAFYLSGETDNPGIVSIWTRTPSGAQFWVTANADTTGDNFDPVLPTSGQTVKSTRDDNKNRLFFSQAQKPEHFPLVNYLDVGRADKAILRIKALRDSLFIIKEDGIYYIAGADPSGAALTTLDATTICLAPETVTKLNNEIYMLSNQGFVRFNENGVSVISFPLERDVKAIQAFDNLSDVAFSTGFERDRIFACWVPVKGDDTTAKLAYVYNIFREQWSTWTKPAVTAGVVAGKFFLGGGLENVLLVQRDTGDNTDFSDETLDVTITSVTGTTAVLDYTWGHGQLTAGHSIHQGAVTAKITAITGVAGSSYTVELDRAAALAAGAATVRRPIYIRVRHHPNACGAAGVTKSFLDFGWVMERNSVSQITLEVASNENGTLTPIRITRTPDAGWGIGGWGSIAWGSDQTVKSVPLRANVPIGHSTGEWLQIGIRHAVSQEKFGAIYSYIVYQNATDVNAIDSTTATVDATP